MNPIVELTQSVRDRFPAACIDLDPAEMPNGTWFLEVTLGDYSVGVEWQSHRGFGLTSNGEPGFGEGADEVYPDRNTAQRRLFTLLERRLPTEPPPVVSLGMLRRARRVTQAGIAERLDIRQASIAKL
jgi:hypothetical protein